MSVHCFRNSRPDTWSMPRPYSDPSLRFLKHGKILPMEERVGIFERLLGKS